MQYQRLAIQGDNSQGIRLTFDYNLMGGVINCDDELFEAISHPQYFDKYKSIVELKIGSIYPNKINVVKEQFSIERQRFSKFVFGMESFFTDFYNPPSSVDKKYIPMSEIADHEKEFFV